MAACGTQLTGVGLPVLKLKRSLTAVEIALLAVAAVTQLKVSKASSVGWVEDTYFLNRHPSFDVVKPNRSLPQMTLTKCGEKCSGHLWCSSFFFTKSGGDAKGFCTLYDVIFFERDALDSLPNTAYYRFASESCPMDNCYFMVRAVSMCLAFFYNSPMSYNESWAHCDDNDGQLVITDDDSKSRYVIRVLSAHIRLFQPGDKLIYLGAKKVGNQFVWNNGKSMPISGSFWSQGEPSQGQDEECAIVKMVGETNSIGWNDNTCGAASVSNILCEHTSGK